MTTSEAQLVLSEFREYFQEKILINQVSKSGETKEREISDLIEN